MKKLVYLLFLFLLLGSSFNFRFSNKNQLVSCLVQPLSLNVTIDQPQSSTSNDGTLHVFVSGGTAPYTIQIISTSSPARVYKKERFELKKLSAGSYVFLVQDAEKHVLQKTIELTPLQ